MAAEKLTKKRLAQIVLMLVILLVAFFYRTFHHEANETPLKTHEKNTALSENSKRAIDN
ncbi:hypothetical protein [Aggregatibacter kilianii]|uniref:hypothetical protein n=1 Tax=Aggregatibacter kilianii TaxID=2025884 RepID=UPI0019550FF5|nr:hypothetical protein [Aggregatibacter kilianii]